MRCKCIVLKSLYNTLDAIVRSKREPVVIIAITKGDDHWFALSDAMKWNDCIKYGKMF